jgi:hypothetical protein
MSPISPKHKKIKKFQSPTQIKFAVQKPREYKRSKISHFGAFKELFAAKLPLKLVKKLF